MTKREWPERDPEGRAVRFTHHGALPHPSGHRPVLAGVAVRLDPMRPEHLDALCEIGLDSDLTSLFPHPVTSAEGMASFVAEALAGREAGTAIPFVTVSLKEPGGERIVGTTRFLNIDRAHRRMEIGATWLGRPWQRTRVNTESKYLLLAHAFEELDCVRIELKTDSLNERSRRAIERIGASLDGFFPSHMITASGRIRHTVYYSIVRDDWPRVKERLEVLLAR